MVATTQSDSLFKGGNKSTGIVSRIGSCFQVVFKSLQFPVHSNLWEYTNAWLKPFARIIPPAFIKKRDENFIHKDRLLALWNDPDISSVVFVALCANVSKESSDEVTQIGLASWSRGNDIEPKCVHWRIRDVHDNGNASAELDDIEHLTRIHLIPRSHIGLLLQQEFDSLLEHFQKLCLVGHSIDTTLKLLSNYWNVPRSVTIVDTQRVLQFHNHQSDLLPFDEAIKTVLKKKRKIGPAHHIKQDTEDTIALLEALGRNVAGKEL